MTRTTLTRLVAAAIVAFSSLASAQAGANAATTAWQIGASANPLNSAGVVSGVSCPTAAQCLAVGYVATDQGVERPAVVRLNGGQWSTMTVVVAGGQAGALHGISCPTEGVCLAVGDGVGPDGPTALVAQLLGGIWVAQLLPAPAGSRSATLQAVSCVASSCVAVGQVTSVANVNSPLAERWDGHRWAAAPAPAVPGGTNATLNAVDCPAASSCLAVGTAGTTGFAAQWDGTGWTPADGAGPLGYTSDLDGVSCPAANDCIAVGGAASQGKVSWPYGPTPLAERWNGLGWTVLGATNPPDANHGSRLSAVSCTSDTSCVATGDETPNLTPTALVETWDGASWNVASIPQSSAAADSHLTGVACAVASRCLAVGTQTRSTGIPTPLAVAGGAGSWTDASPPAPTGPQLTSLRGLSCVSPDRCVAVGQALSSEPANSADPGAAGALTPLIEVTNGHTSRLDHPAVGPDQSDFSLESVDCPTADRCVAVGEYENSDGLLRPGAEILKDGTWQVAELPVPADTWHAYLFSISCAAVDDCVAVGFRDVFTTQSFQLSEHWDGSSWRQLPLATPPGPTEGPTLFAVACPAHDLCIAGGDDLAEIWNGTSWTIHPLPNASTQPGTQSDTTIHGISCRSAQWCELAGDYVTFDRPRPGPVAIFHWDGASLSVQPTQDPPIIYDAFETLRAISCSAPTQCEAVGFYYQGSGADAGYHPMAERWDGHQWQLDPPADPPGHGTELHAVSCLTALCVTVGTSSSNPAAQSPELTWPATGLIESRHN